MRGNLTWLRFFLVLGSLSPVFILWGIRGQSSVPGNWWELGCVAMFVLPNLVLWDRIATAKRRNDTQTVEVLTARDQREHLLTYLFAMLIPLYDANLGDARSVVAVGAALAFVVFLFWHMNLHYMNLLFAFWGYRIFTVELRGAAGAGASSHPETGILITKRHHIAAGTPVTGLALGGQVFLEPGK